MTTYQHNQDFIQDIQKAAEYESPFEHDEIEIAHNRLSSSRDAMLSLINLLAQQSVPQLSIAGVGTFIIAGFYTVALPSPDADSLFRLLLWIALTIGTLIFTAHRLHLFRKGYAYNGRPFTWRAHYTSTLAVLSTTIGLGTILLTPQSMPPESILIICGSIVLISTVLGNGHLAHRSAALCVATPGILIALTVPLLRIAAFPDELHSILAIFELSSLALSIAVLTWGNAQARRLINNALQAHPRSELSHINARHKQTSSAYNPFSIKTSQDAKWQSDNYNPREL